MSTLTYRIKHWLKAPVYWLYEQRLGRKAKTWHKPGHVAIVMDGNRRFAKAIGVDDVTLGHNAGADTLTEVLKWCFELGISTVTVWALSLDNFERSKGEVEHLLTMFERKFREIAEHETIHKYKVRVGYLGRIDSLPDHVQDAIEFAEERTGHYTAFRLNIAVAYGGREEIVDAIRQYLDDAATAGRTARELADTFEAESVNQYLYTSGQPEPDLIIRTSGEIRMSGFLLWQSVYSEFYFCETFWPAFRRIDFLRALRSYDLRQRRFGK